MSKNDFSINWELAFALTRIAFGIACIITAINMG